MVLLGFVLGLCFGSFSNALTWRVATGRGIGGRSMCPHCKKTLMARDLIPVVSFLVLRGRCRTCHKKISWQYPIVEVVTALSFALIAIQPIAVPQIMIEWVIAAVLMSLFVIDLRYGILPDVLTIPAIIGVIGIRVLLGDWSTVGVDMLLGGLVGFSFFGLQWVLSKGKWIGDGDIRFGVLMGVLLGFPTVFLALMMSYSIGAMVAIGLLTAHKRQWGSRIALGPFLVVGTVIAYYWGGWILTLFGL